MYASVCEKTWQYLHHVRAGTGEGQKETSDPLELELWESVSCSLGTELDPGLSPAKAVSSTADLSLQPHKNNFKYFNLY